MGQMNGISMYKLIAKHFGNKPFSTQLVCAVIKASTNVVYQQSACSMMLNSLYKEELLTKDGKGVFRRKVISPTPDTSRTFAEAGREIYEYIESLKNELKVIEDLEEENTELRKEAEKFKGFGGTITIPGMKD